MTVNTLQLQTEYGEEGEMEMQRLLQQFQDIFSDPGTLPIHRNCVHKIPLKQGAKPINLRPYRYSSLQKDTLESLIKEMMHVETIQPSNNPYSSLVVLVKKRDGSWRMCVDYRALNSQTIKNKYLYLSLKSYWMSYIERKSSPSWTCAQGTIKFVWFLKAYQKQLSKLMMAIMNFW